MESDRTFYDRDYKRTCAYIGWALLIFIGLFNIMGLGVGYISSALEGKMTYEWYYTLDSVLNMAAYLASFLIPAFFLRLLLKRREIFHAPLYSFKFDPTALLLIPGAIATALVASYVNSMAMSGFGVSEAYSVLIGMDGSNYEVYQILLMYISSALVPAFCEELLFRGTILANLMPYSKCGAIVISSILFGLMHQNPYQIIYTVAAGIILGMAYTRTRSIWWPTIIHFVNNAYSVTTQVIYGNVRANLANSILLVLQLMMVVLGTVAMVFYIKLSKKEASRKFDDGFFGREISQDFRYSQKPLSRGYAVKGFFRPSIIIFGVVSAMMMLLLLLSLLSMTFGATTI